MLKSISIKDIREKGWFFFLQIFLIFCWMLLLFNTSSYFAVYILAGLFSVFSISVNRRRKTEPSIFENVIISSFSLLFSLLVFLANYDIFLPWRENLFDIFLVLIGGFTIAWNILLFLLIRTPMKEAIYVKKPFYRSFLVFIIPFVLFIVIDLIYLYCSAYPGNLTPDSINQVGQAVNGFKSNHHPFWHTVIIKGILTVGKALFGNITDAVALYSVLQILFTAFAFSFSLMTLYQAGVKLRYVILCGLPFALFPYHIVYSVTMWKDIVFGAAAILFVSFLFRVLNSIGNRIANGIFLFLFTVAFCVWRSNAWLAMVATLIFILFFFRKKHWKVTLLLFGAVVLSWIMRSPFISMMNISQPDLVESLSIPVQQVARVIVDQGNITEEEYEFLDQMMDVDRVPELYTPHISDPIKNEIRRKNHDFLVENKVDFAILWVKVGLRNPACYLKAWVDQTKGYYNSGYPYWIFIEAVEYNDLGIERAEKTGEIKDFFDEFFKDFRENELYRPLISIGLWVWILMALGITAFLKKRKETILYVPLILVIATLLVATPVYSEFRYAYSVFTTLPFLTVIGLHEFKNEKGEEKNG